MGYEFFIDGVQLPVAPSKMQMRIANKNKTITLINDTEVNVLHAAGLTEIAFEVMLPQVKYPFAVYKDGFKPAAFYLSKLESLKAEAKAFQFIVSRMSAGGNLLFDTNLKVSLEEYSIVEDASEGLDLMISIKLKQYVEYGTKEVVLKPSSVVASTTKMVSSPKKRESSKTVPKTYTVKSGDTLWGICKSHLGDGSKYASIAKLNGISNPSLIKVGMVLKLG